MLDFSIENKYREESVCKEGFYAYLVIHSKEEGMLRDLILILPLKRRFWNVMIIFKLEVMLGHLEVQMPQ